MIYAATHSCLLFRIDRSFHLLGVLQIMSTIPENTDDVIDSRDVIARIEELESDAESHGEGWADCYRDEASELATLNALADEASGSADWQYGETLIRDSYFKSYARELADDIGAIPESSAWPCTCIDWDQASRELQMDYMSVDFDGVTYWIRS